MGETGPLIVERDEQIESLLEYADEARDGGRVVLVGGEAGSGKSTLVRMLAERLDHRFDVMVGVCDPYDAPNAFGPLFDLLPTLPRAVAAGVTGSGSRESMFGAILDHLSGGARVLVIEDVHWADEATLDLLRFLGRRAGRTTALLIWTYRSDEIGPRHPFRSLVSSLESGTLRVDLPPLTTAGIEMLAAGRAVDPSALREATGGNPFFVSEVLSHPTETVPASVSDAILGRAATLPEEAWRVLEVVALCPNGIRLDALDRVVDGASVMADLGVERGLLTVESGRVRARHDLIRLAIDREVPPGRRRRIHTAVLDVLDAEPVEAEDLAPLAHHAVNAGEGRRAVDFSMRAAEHAAAKGAHVQAVGHLTNALGFRSCMDEAQLDAALEAASYECYLTNDTSSALAFAQELLTIRTDPAARGRTHRWLSRLSWFEGRPQEALEAGTEAVRLLESAGESEELAFACSNMAQLMMLDQRLDDTRVWAERALDLARRLEVREVEVHALNNLGTVLWACGDPSGRHLLEQSLDIALADGFEEHAARAYTNMAFQAVWTRMFDLADRSTLDGIRFTELRDLDTWAFYMTGTRAELLLLRGDWKSAASLARSVLDRDPSPITRQQSLSVAARLAVRTGSNGAAEMVARHHALAWDLDDFIRRLAAASVDLEAAWHLGKHDEILEAEARDVLAEALERGDSWGASALVFWMTRLGWDPGGGALPDPLIAEMRGDVDTAIDMWTHLGCPYEAAVVAATASERDQVREAIDRLLDLGATATVDAIRRDLAEAGMVSVPRGSEASTREHPLGLTRRQDEVLGQLRLGRTNAEIAEALFISEKTVDHHVSAILSALGAKTRGEAVAIADRTSPSD